MMDWVSRVETWLESIFTRAFRGKAEPMSGAEVVLAGKREKEDLRREADQMTGALSGNQLDLVHPTHRDTGDNTQNTNLFILPSERRGQNGRADGDQTIRWMRKSGYALEIVKGREAGTTYSGSNACMIGRAGDCDVTLSDVTVSKYHARINLDELGWFVEDLGSTNGTFVNGKRVSKAYLKNEDTLRLGLTELRFRRRDSSEK